MMSLYQKPTLTTYFADRFNISVIEQRIINLILEYKQNDTSWIRKTVLKHRFEELFGPSWKVEIEKILNSVGHNVYG